MARKGNPISVRVKVIFSLCLLYFIFHFPLLAFFIRLLGQIQKHIAVWGSHWPFALKLLSSDLMVCGLITTSSEKNLTIKGRVSNKQGVSSLAHPFSYWCITLCFQSRRGKPKLQGMQETNPAQLRYLNSANTTIGGLHLSRTRESWSSPGL